MTDHKPIIDGIMDGVQDALDGVETMFDQLFGSQFSTHTRVFEKSAPEPRIRIRLDNQKLLRLTAGEVLEFTANGQTIQILFQ